MPGVPLGVFDLAVEVEMRHAEDGRPSMFGNRER